MKENFMKVDRGTPGHYTISFPGTNRINLLFTGTLLKEVSALQLTEGDVLILDMEGIQFVDSAGFECLLSIVNDAHRLQFRIEIRHIGCEVRELISLLNLEQIFMPA